MKKSYLASLLCCTLALANTYGQVSNGQIPDPVDETNFLKNYKAPDFKQKRLNANLNARSGNFGQTFGSEQGGFNQASSLNYSQFSNTARYQGNLSTGVGTSLVWSKSDLNKRSRFDLDLSLSSSNRFYLKERLFIGVYGDAMVGGSLLSTKTGTQTVSSQGAILYGLSGVSIGLGRLEPIQYARNAMDIERSLRKGGRLNGSYSASELNQIANRLAEINNVRFFDFRLRRIEQFEAIDKELRQIGGISDFDMTYFAHLSDAYLYAQNFERYSGFRNEAGLMQSTIFLANNLSGGSAGGSTSTGVFYNLVYDLPSSYAVQHTIKTGVLAGALFVNDTVGGSFNQGLGIATASYELGLFPTTRTNFNAGVRAGGDLFSGSLGGEVYVNGTIYFSPQLRLRFNCGFNLNENLYISNYGGTIPGGVFGNGNFRLNSALKLGYAIF